MSGQEFVTALGELSIEVPVMLLSAQGAEEAREELGAADALAKPFDPYLLVDRVAALAADSAQPHFGRGLR